MRALTILLLILCGQAALAQVVNIENKRFNNDTARWSGFATFRYSVTENTQRSIALGANGGVQYVRDRHSAFFITDFTVDRVETNAFRNTGFQHLRHNQAWPGGPWSMEAYTQLQYNKPLRIDGRWMIGVGPRFVVRNGDIFRLALGTSLLFEHEVDRVNDITENTGRSSSYLSVAFKWEPHMQFTSVVYYQPKVADASDHRVAVEGQFRIRATERFGLETRINLQKDTRMAPGIPELNYRWENGFSFLF